MRLNGEFVETSVGRIIFNEILPAGFVFQNKVMNSKVMEKLIREIFEEYGQEVFHDVLDKIKVLGSEYSTESGVTWGMDDLIVPPEKKEIIEKAEKEIANVDSHYQKGLLSQEEKKDKVIEIWHRVI